MNSITSNTKKITFFFVTLFILLVLAYLGPIDGFSHGFFAEEIDYSTIAQMDWQDKLYLDTSDYEITFSPQKNHFAGFSILLTNQPEGNIGNLTLTVLDQNKKILDTIKVDLEKVKESTWYKVKTTAKLEKNKIYTLNFSANDCLIYPQLYTVDEDYLPTEICNGNILVSFAYEKSTFTFQNKVIIFIAIIGLWTFLFSLLFNKKYQCRIAYVSSILCMTALLSWNYMYNSMDQMNTKFNGFQHDSEMLVNCLVIAQHYDVHENYNVNYMTNSNYGLGFYVDSLTEYTDDVWLKNYSRTEPSIVVNANDYSKQHAVIGNKILFKNGDCHTITNVIDDGASIIIYLDTERIMNPYKYGMLTDAVYCDSYGNQISSVYSCDIFPYVSQYGLQGKVFKYLTNYMNYDEIFLNFNLACSILTAFVFSIIVLLIYLKYNALFAVTFLYTFWLSPWTVNFAKNLYWLEFTWFIPMAIGLFCAWKIDCKACRIISYLLTYISILIKCLCGYEYISVIMMGLILFLLADFITAIFKHETKKITVLLKTIIIIGVLALAGFMTAICMHAPLKGDGDIIIGLKNIFEQDVLRRTVGADLNVSNPNYLASYVASVWETYCKYFHFETEVVTGITGNMFPLLCIIPLAIFGMDIKNKRTNIELISLYIVSFLTSVSWFCLAKGHSYVHTFLNYVLWYFGFVQVCLYIIINKIQIYLNKK